MNFETTPIKTIISLIETGDSSILGVKDHKKVAAELIEKYKEVFPISKSVISRMAKIESLELEKFIINTLIESLNVKKDDEAINLLNSYGYDIGMNYIEDLDVIKKQANSVINARLNDLKMQIEEVDIDRIILTYCSISGVTCDTNKITTKQFKALEEICQEKVK